MKTYETITVDHPQEHTVLVTLNRPEVANAMNTQMGLDLVELFEGFSTDIEGLRAVILTGSGDKAFCAGGDLKQRNGMTDVAWQAQHLVFERMLRAVLGCPIPVIGAGNGAAYGGGCEIAAATDFVYAATHARFAVHQHQLAEAGNRKRVLRFFVSEVHQLLHNQAGLLLRDLVLLGANLCARP